MRIFYLYSYQKILIIKIRKILLGLVCITVLINSWKKETKAGVKKPTEAVGNEMEVSIETVAVKLML